MTVARRAELCETPFLINTLGGEDVEALRFRSSVVLDGVLESCATFSFQDTTHTLCWLGALESVLD